MRFLDDNREYIRTYHRWENGCKPYIEVHIEADWWDAEYKEEETIPKWKCDNCIYRPPNKEK
jgi:hypothetical protein